MTLSKILAGLVLISILVLVSKHEIEKRNSGSHLHAQDGKREILVLVLKHETERKKFPFLSRNTRLKDCMSHSCLKI